MKLKTLVGSMMVLGLVGTGVMADSEAAEDVSKAATDAADQAFWSSIIDRNQDSAYLVPNLSRNGQFKLSGLAKVSTTARVNRHNTDLSKNDLSEDTEALFIDALVNDFTTLHLVLGYDYKNIVNHLDGSNSNSTQHTSDNEFYFPEAYAKMTYGNFFTKVGQQYLNFGSTSHQSISTPVTQTLSNIDQVAITFGVQNLGGFYADMALYKGADMANADSPTRSNGYDVDVGYALHNDAYSLNVYADYISDMADIDAINRSLEDTKISSHRNVINKRIPGMAVHADLTMGPLQLLADYVAALEPTDVRDYEFNKSGAQPSAYSIEASYNFMPKQTITIGVQGTKESLGLAEAFLPKERLLAAYNYQLSPHVSLQGEYTHDKAYASDENYGNRDSEEKLTSGSGRKDNIIVARLKIAF